MDQKKNNDISLKNEEFLVESAGVRRRLHLPSIQAVRFEGQEEEPFTILEGNPALGHFTLLFRNRVFRITADSSVARADGGVGDMELRINRSNWRGRVDDRRSLLARRFGAAGTGSSGEVVVKAPMPGLVSRILAKKDQSVARGEGLLILEAMKMENEIRAEHEGRIVRIDCIQGKPVEKNAPLLVIHYGGDKHA